MANCCSTTYKCVGDPKEIAELHGILESLTSRRQWLSELVTELGFDNSTLRCRGEILDYNLDPDNILTIYQETAWCEQEGVRNSIEKKFPSIKVYYRDEEPGCEVYCTNDNGGDFFPEKFLLDAYEIYEYFYSIGDAIDYIQDSFDIKVKEQTYESVRSAIDDYLELHPEVEYMCFHEFHYCED